MAEREHVPDYDEIARLERELGLGDPPPAPGAPMFARCAKCGAKVHEGATACNHCGYQEFRVEDSW